jgi:hypothetical protein
MTDGMKMAVSYQFSAQRRSSATRMSRAGLANRKMKVQHAIGRAYPVYHVRNFVVKKANLW